MQKPRKRKQRKTKERDPISTLQGAKEEWSIYTYRFLKDEELTQGKSTNLQRELRNRNGGVTGVLSTNKPDLMAVA